MENSTSGSGQLPSCRKSRRRCSERQSELSCTLPASLRDSTLFSDVFKTSPFGIAIEDLDGRVLYANAALCSVLGLTEDEATKRHCCEFSPPEDAEKDWALFQQLRSGAIDRYEMEKRYYRADGTLMWGQLFVNLLNTRRSPLVVARILDITKRKHTEETFESIAGKLIEVQEQERSRIARELHDDIGQRIVLAAVQIDELLSKPPDGQAEFVRAVCDLKEQVFDILSGLQSISHQMHSPELEHLGLLTATRSFCERFAARSKLAIDFHGENFSSASVPHDVSLAIYRILQEALQNVVKHSHASQIKVVLQNSNRQLHLAISDNGVGFDPNIVTSKPSLGLISMRERARLLKGTMVIESKPMEGTTIDLYFPVQP